MQLHVRPLLWLPSEERPRSPSVFFHGDPRVSNLLRLVERGHRFHKNDWVGGDGSLEKLCLCNRKKTIRCKCGSSDIGGHSGLDGLDECVRSNTGFAEEIADLRAEVCRLKEANSKSLENLRLSIVSDLKSSFGLRSHSWSMSSLENSSPLQGHAPLCTMNALNISSSPAGPSVDDVAIAVVAPATSVALNSVSVTRCASTLSSVSFNAISHSSLPPHTAQP